MGATLRRRRLPTPPARPAGGSRTGGSRCTAASTRTATPTIPQAEDVASRAFCRVRRWHDRRSDERASTPITVADYEPLARERWPRRRRPGTTTPAAPATSGSLADNRAGVGPAAPATAGARRRLARATWPRPRSALRLPHPIVVAPTAAHNLAHADAERAHRPRRGGGRSAVHAVDHLLGADGGGRRRRARRPALVPALRSVGPGRLPGAGRARGGRRLRGDRPDRRPALSRQPRARPAQRLRGRPRRAPAARPAGRPGDGDHRRARPWTGTSWPGCARSARSRCW